MLQFPCHTYRDRDNNVIGASHLSPTDSVIVTLGKQGMRRRLVLRADPQLPSDTAMLLLTKNSVEDSMVDVEIIG
jgi:hypothetical protein